ncbi:MAG TPA: TraR/DksA family transcriptional regulator [Polyangiaceae bacterium]|nr:TraR/DksA family transcriptional regulator [Polyangiaceae bacterium]
MSDAGLTDSQLLELRTALVEKRNALLRQITRETQAMTTAVGGEAELMDQAEQARELDDRAQRNVRENVLLEELDAALRKIEDGSYGLSEDSGEPIGFGRLRALPWARRTAREEEEIERG